MEFVNFVHQQDVELKNQVLNENYDLKCERIYS